VGEDVTFGTGELAPDTPRGANLLEHELGHVVEQRQGAPLGVYRAPVGETDLAREPRAAPHVKLDPGIGGLSLGLSTLDDFDLNEAMLKPKHRAALADVAQKLTMLLMNMPAGRISVTGHTDALGGENVNLAVGRRRAEAVAAALEKEGVPAASIRVVTEGKHEPVVATKGAEPRNRRVEVRFEGGVVVPDAGPRLGGGLQLGGDRPAKIDLTYHPKLDPSSQPPFLQPQAPLPKPSAGPSPPLPAQGAPERDQPTRPGKAGDVLKAVSKTEPIKTAIAKAEQELEGKWDRLATGEKVFVVSTVVSIGAIAGAGVGSDPTARKTVLDMVDGAEIPVPGKPWLKLKAHTKGGGVGGGIQIDVIKLFGGGK
jgi:outer membrane protein OmpA-like peptidoglycan-associated protein